MRVLLIQVIALLFPYYLAAQTTGRPLPDTLVVCHKAPTPQMLGVWEDLPDSLDCQWSSQDISRGASYSHARIFSERLSPGFYRFKRQILDSLRVVEEDSLVLHVVDAPKVIPREIVIPTCDNSGDGAIRLQAYPEEEGIQYSWNNGENSPALERLNSGTYEVTVSDKNNCSRKQTFALMSPEPINIDLLLKEDASCGKVNGSAVVKASGGVGDFSYIWNTEEGYRGVGLDGLTPGDYVVKAEDSRGCWDTLQISIKDLPFRQGKINSIPADTLPLCVSQATVSFDAEDRYADRYIWDFGDSTRSESLNPTHTFTAPGIYSVVCTMYELGNDCPAKDSLRFEIQHNGELVIPELFSPNGDGVNDQFYVRGYVQSLEMQIFQTNGKLVKTINSPDEKWNGRNEEGRKLAQGDYLYKVKAELSICEDLEQQGIVKLVR